MDLVRAGIAAIDLVHDHNGANAAGERLAEHELSLRQHAFGGIDEQDGAIDHAEDALHLAAEVGVARGVDNVEARPLPDDAGALRQDGDAALTLEVIAVQRALGHVLVVTEGAGLLQQSVDERSLPMIDVGDDGDVCECP